MGIPAYYSYLIKNYQKIIVKRNKLNSNIDNFYLDSNSIIYNCLQNIEGEFNQEFVNKLIMEVCLQIDNYIKEIEPSELVYISFDGVAPYAKLKQQKERRFKSKLMTELVNDILKDMGEYNEIMDDNIKEFDRTCITPGTEFMNILNKQVKNYFKNREGIYQVKKIIVSGSDERGEGEHKIFDYIRKNNKKSSTHVVYGLDADLIILCLNHMNISKQIYLFRETPEFIKSINISINPDELYLMKIEELMYLILEKMIGNKKNVRNTTNVIKDYVFIMFLLGNDFMPHFPSLNIRTHGIEMLLETYKNILGRKNMYIIDNDTIVWKNVRELIDELSKMEMDNLIREYKIRNKQSRYIENNHYDNENMKESMEKELLNLPLKDREDELIIDPFKKYWENRYYERLFNTKRNEENLKKICLNYIQGLEWNMIYYTSGCKDWKWRYNYHYPPLFKDLLKFIPIWDIEYIKENNDSLNPITQLAYVLPKSSLYLLPKKYQTKLTNYKRKTNDVELKWAFCRYMWECHIDFQLENIEEIDNIVKNIDNSENIVLNFFK